MIRKQARQTITLFGSLMLGMSSIASAQNGDEVFDGSFDFMVTLTVDNYLSWCSVTVGNLAASGIATFSLSEHLGSTVFVDAEPKTGFVWGYWTGTDGDTSTAHDENELTTVTMAADKTVLSCCPFAAEPVCP